MEHLISAIDLGHCHPLDQKKPKSHLGFLKREKGEKTYIHFSFKRERERERASESINSRKNSSKRRKL